MPGFNDSQSATTIINTIDLGIESDGVPQASATTLNFDSDFDITYAGGIPTISGNGLIKNIGIQSNSVPQTSSTTLNFDPGFAITYNGGIPTITYNGAAPSTPATTTTN